MQSGVRLGISLGGLSPFSSHCLTDNLEKVVFYPGCLKHECDVAEKVDANFGIILLYVTDGYRLSSVKCLRVSGLNNRHYVIINVAMCHNAGCKSLPSRSLNIPRPPRVDGGGLPLCGMPLNRILVYLTGLTLSVFGCKAAPVYRVNKKLKLQPLFEMLQTCLPPRGFLKSCMGFPESGGRLISVLSLNTGEAPATGEGLNRIPCANNVAVLQRGQSTLRCSTGQGGGVN